MRLALRLIYVVALVLIVLGLQGCEVDNAADEETSILTTTYSTTTTIEPTTPQLNYSLEERTIKLDLGSAEIRKYKWEFKEKVYTMKLAFYSGSYDIYKGRTRARNYDLFASDPYDDIYIKEIARQLSELGTSLDDWDIPPLAISFIQSLPYTSDLITTGFDEYPRFPFETLYDDGGDCEDTSILAAAILEEMGYGVVLVELPGHMAVGVECDKSVEGSRYEFQGKDYCYLETTSEGWALGQIPDEFKGVSAEILSVQARPYLETDFNASYSYDSTDTYVGINATLQNLGTEAAKCLRIYAGLEASEPGKVWDQIMGDNFTFPSETTARIKVKNLHAPSGQPFRIIVRAIGDNIVSEPAYSDWITWTFGSPQ